ncbi:MAG TPA: MFS transporter [Methylomirabilota bacterium]|nr:MFS transporter [Methylomirabilota bacterium]
MTTPPARRWTLLAILTTAYGAGAFGMLGISPLTPSLVEGFGLTRLQVALIVPSIYIGGLFCSLPGGRLADRLGARKSLLGGLAVGAAGLVGAAAAPGFAAFLLFLVCAGIGWSVVNPALGKAIMDVFPMRERGVAMGIKQMGLTLGGLVGALALPLIAAALGWRAAILACGVGVAVPVLAGWSSLAPLDAGAGARGDTTRSAAADWSWVRRPALLVFFAAGLLFGMVQAAVLSYLPLYAVQALGLDKIGAGVLVAWTQAGGAVSRLAFGAGSDRWLAGRRSLWLALPGAVGAVIFLVYATSTIVTPLGAGALAFLAGVGAYGWVGIFFVISAEIGGARQAGLLSGMAFASIVIGLLVGPSVFGLLLVAADSYRAAWAAFAAIATLVTLAAMLAGPAIDREAARPSPLAAP